MSWIRAAIPLLPMLPVVAMTGVAVLMASLLPVRGRARRMWFGTIVLLGAVAVAASWWLESAAETTLEREGAEMQTLLARMERLNGSLPPGTRTAPDGIVDAVIAELASRDKIAADLRRQIAALQAKSKARTIDDAVAAKMTEFLRPYGGHRVVISCVPDDVEAFNYGNQLANILKAAGWQALGPEATTIFGTAPAMGVSLSVHDAAAADTAQILLGAFAKFNIPYESRVASDQAIPDPDTIELHIAPKP